MGEFRDGAWRGEPCYIIGGGPSLRDFDWSLMAGRRHVIVVNQAFKQVPDAELWFSEDIRVLELNHDSPVWRAFGGRRVLHSLDSTYTPRALSLDPSLTIISRQREGKYWSRSLDEGLSYASNSGVGAINLAWILGADPIFLLGFDCRGERGKESNYHRDYERAGFDRTGDHQYQSFASDFTHWVAPHVRNVRVVNVINPRFPSALSCWPNRTFAEVFGVLNGATCKIS